MIVLPFSILLSILIYFFPEYIAAIFREKQLAFYLKFFAIGIPFGVFIILAKSVLNGFFKIKYLFFIENFESFMGLIFVAFFLFLGWQLLGGIVGYLVALFLTSILAGYFLFKTILLKNLRFIFDLKSKPAFCKN